MFRVDVYSHEGGDKLNRLEPAYASLSTAAADGQLLTVGRKNATFLLDKDKSVSRDHTHVYLMSNNNVHHGVAGVPSSSTESEACDKGPMGTAIRVLCLGKFGTVVLAIAPHTVGDDSNKQQDATGSKNDSDTDAGDGSDTEDESQKMTDAKPTDGFSLPTIAGVEWQEKTKEISAKLLQGKKHKIVASDKLDAKQSTAVPGNATTIILQCGQHGSILVLTKMDLLVCKSQWPAAKKVQDKWKKELYKLGAQLVEEDIEDTLLKVFAQQKSMPPVFESPLPPTVYLITPQRGTSHKQLIAWYLGFPFATLEFLQKLLDRETPQDPWPNHEEFDPPSKGIPKDLDQNFWKETQTSPELWRNSTFLMTSGKKQDAQANCSYIVKAAGGCVIQLQDMDEQAAKDKVLALVADPAKKDGLFSCSAPGGKKKVLTLMKEQGIPRLSAKKITTTFAQQQLLEDDKTGRVIGNAAEAEKETKEPPPEEETPPESPDSDATEAEEEIKPEEKESSGSKSSKRKLEYLNENESSGDDSDKKKGKDCGGAAEKESPPNRSKKRSRKNKSQENEPSQSHMSQSQPQLDVLPSVQEEESMDLNDSALSEGKAVSPAKSKKRGAESQAEASENSNKAKRTKAKESQSRCPLEPGSARLESTDDGWLVAAPKNADREAYLRPVEEILEHFEERGKGLMVAETVECSDLVFRPYDPNRNTGGNGSMARVGMKSKSGKDFKRFRKNSIILGKKRIELKAEMTKDSSALRALESAQQAIDEQQREADELFTDFGKKQSKIKRRRRA